MHYVIVQQPVSSASQLFLLYHGVGDTPESMAEIGSWFGRAFPEALVVAVGAPQRDHARQWFIEAGGEGAASQVAIDAILPTFVETVQHWQQKSGVSPLGTALVGFSQGATLILEGINAHPELAGRVIAFSGRFNSLPAKASRKTTIHLIHGDNDRQIPLTHAVDAEERVAALGGDITLDIIDELPHAIDDKGINIALNHLRNTVPKRYFDEALGGAKPGEDDVVMMM
ncbi:esterase [Candidatus Pantoea multigeneris]|uniref:Esterase n=1 Tax=Candidatus Pantoea multigeneris TaxID=2608357 RepID=A0ABX0R6E3_9GAMM|nr:esterase [Pantoea multigeneris]NIF20955.1 esterase [Pantoea multigeneris]